MNAITSSHRRAIAVLLSATALVATPTLAQEATTSPAAQAVPVQVAPPPVVPTVVAPAAQTRTSGDAASPTPVNAAAAEQAAAEDAQRAPAQRRATPRPVARAAAPAARVAAPRTATPAAPAATTPAPAPVAAASAPAVTAPTESVAAPATPPVQQASASTTTTERRGVPIWPFALIAALVIAAGAFFFLRGRRRTHEEEIWDEPVYTEEAAQPMTIEPAPVVEAPAAAPVAAAAAAPAFLDRTPPTEDRIEAIAAAPAVPEDAAVVEAASEDVAALTADAPVSDRPWLEFAMRPVRAGTSEDEAVVEIELTVGNAGQVRAENVRISTFMLQNDDAGEMERLLTRPPVDAAVAPVDIDPGEGTRIDATLAIPKGELAEGGFQPIIVADARYRLPGGGEGRTSASFLIGVSTDGGTALTPIQTARPQIREDVGAELYREPQHA